MLHGNAGQACDRSYILGHVPDADAVYVMEYPGYGARAGKPSLESLNAAASSAYRALVQTYPGTPVCVVGESLGSGPASALALEHTPPPKIILITPFDVLARVAAHRFFFLPVRWLLLDRWNNAKSLSRYSGSLVVYAATQDSVIPIHHAKALAAPLSAARFIEIPGGHNDWAAHDAVRISRD